MDVRAVNETCKKKIYNITMVTVSQLGSNDTVLDKELSVFH